MVKKLSETNERKAGAAPGKSANIFIEKCRKSITKNTRIYSTVGSLFSRPRRSNISNPHDGVPAFLEGRTRIQDAEVDRGSLIPAATFNNY